MCCNKCNKKITIPQGPQGPAGTSCNLDVQIVQTETDNVYQALVTGSGSYTYEWSLNNNDLNSSLEIATTAGNLITLQEAKKEGTPIGLLKVKVTSSTGCVAYDYFLVLGILNEA
jgi:hypothetical protein